METLNAYAVSAKEMQALVSGESVRGPFRLIVIALTLALQGCITAPKLDRLMRQALADNPSLTQAMARVREAQSLADVAQAGLAPSTDCYILPLCELKTVHACCQAQAY
jgi:outer membrane protein TolC